MRSLSSVRRPVRISGLRLTALLLLLALFTVLQTGKLREAGEMHTRAAQRLSQEQFRAEFFSEEMRGEADVLSAKCRKYLRQVEREAVYFPIPASKTDESLTVSYVNTWMTERTYGGKRGHEGVDLMASRNERGVYPIVSVCDGVITNLGWLEKGGYRIGITSDSGTYYYYAHMDSYANIREGDRVQAGEFLGYMGDSGYGSEGTKGKFDVHLHFGVYFYEDGNEYSVNPYYLLQALENNKLKYEYS